MINNIKVVVAMSGGVDSSISAWLLKKQGYHVEGVFMKNWENEDNSKYCTINNDFIDVKKVCNQLNIKLHIVNFSFEYWENVFKIFLKEYKLGNTPNPDILCNKEIKFKTFFNFAIKDLKADYIATGHYAQIIKIKNNFYLLKGFDKNKDQSYFLYNIKSCNLSKILFPLGRITKLKVRYLAKKIKLINFNKKDSTGICFVGKRKFIKFIKNYIKPKPGLIIDTKKNIVGKHDGVMYYTLGQRKGLKIGGIKNTLQSPWYIIDKNIKKNYLIVSQGFNNSYLISYKLIANNLSWINNKISNIKECFAKTRYRQKDLKCKISLINKKNILVIFKKPVFAVNPGQSIVFYYKNFCLGGGIIYKSFKKK
ncbi:tRNA 2-thiouridine(34) synthase MnmA [Sodalis-like secondary symbiont of Drepanosiphum platanoidis]|uniref:tRNA 2-thiouridine(34) synthase MnmA n=1 Tax=Sodalis-like secondary symbiont of Drepanosiphum platanoidis TaxID=2994493 RepID=UPI003464AFF2